MTIPDQESKTQQPVVADHLTASGKLQPEAGERARRLEKMRAIVEEIASWPETGLKADKAFFDELSGDDDTQA